MTPPSGWPESFATRPCKVVGSEVCVAVDVAVGVALGVALDVWLAVALGVAVGASVGVALGVAVAVALAVALGVALAVGGGAVWVATGIVEVAVDSALLVGVAVADLAVAVAVVVGVPRRRPPSSPQLETRIANTASPITAFTRMRTTLTRGTCRTTTIRPLACADGFLTRRPFLVGDRATSADTACYSYVAHAAGGNVALTDYPKARP